MNKAKQGQLYGGSLGPGDPGLITRRVWELLQDNDIHWTYPIRRKGAKSHALDIVLRAGLSLPVEQTALIFPMTHDVKILASYWLRAAEAVLEKLQRGQDVIFLVEGDASTYSTFNHLVRAVHGLDKSIVIETIAGVPSYNAAAAKVSMPLADTDETVAIVPAGYGIGMIERMLEDFDTLVLLKVKPLLDDILDLLQRRGLIEHAAFIEKIGAPEERIIKDVLSLKGNKVNYLSLLLIRNPHRQRGVMIRGCRKITGNK
jgi:precorrin-2/cobalt-factor-2 C20-methyltransferase